MVEVTVILPNGDKEQITLQRGTRSQLSDCLDFLARDDSSVVTLIGSNRTILLTAAVAKKCTFILSDKEK